MPSIFKKSQTVVAAERFDVLMAARVRGLKIFASFKGFSVNQVRWIGFPLVEWPSERWAKFITR